MAPELSGQIDRQTLNFIDQNKINCLNNIRNSKFTNFAYGKFSQNRLVRLETIEDLDKAVFWQTELLRQDSMDLNYVQAQQHMPELIKNMRKRLQLTGDKEQGVYSFTLA